jgi:Acyl CoA:acetate/3-ketoacid CoA transferase, beta subunit
MLRHSPRAFVETLDFMTSVGDNVRVVVTDLGILEPRAGELTLVAIHPGVEIDDVSGATGWNLRVAHEVPEPMPPDRRGARRIARARDERTSGWQ